MKNYPDYETLCEEYQAGNISAVDLWLSSQTKWVKNITILQEWISRPSFWNCCHCLYGLPWGFIWRKYRKLKKWNMSIRSEAMATRYRGELSYQLQDVLHRNGMRAQVALVEDKYVLIVQGHDSPVWNIRLLKDNFRHYLMVAQIIQIRKPIIRSTAL